MLPWGEVSCRELALLAPTTTVPAYVRVGARAGPHIGPGAVVAV